MQTRQPDLTATPMAPTTSVAIGTCYPFPIGLEIVRTVKKFADEFCVKDANGNTVFSLQRPSFSAHKRSFLLDNAGNTVVTLRRKRMTAHNRWQVFRGKSDKIKDLLFSVKRPNILHLNTALEVFLPKNTEEKVCEFKVEGSWSNGSCDVYAVQSCNIVAQMGKHVVQSTGSDKGNFLVRVEANVDSAFIVALIVILGLE